jgi:hypothetical protein
MKKTHSFTTPIRNTETDFLVELDDGMAEDTWQQKSRALQNRRWSKLRRQTS